MKASKSSCPALPAVLLAAWVWLAAPPEVAAFCGFYVGKADASLYNEASQVVLVRNANRSVISMMNDYKGELTEFALVVPVPVVGVTLGCCWLLNSSKRTRLAAASSFSLRYSLGWRRNTSMPRAISAP